MVRNTMQKDITYSTLCMLEGHPTAEEVYEEVHRNYPSISKATVYRNLATLEEMNLVRRVRKVGSGPDRFDKNLHPHYHAKCVKCGKIFDVTANISEDIIGSAELMDDGKDFLISSYELVFEGICSKCNAKE